MNHMRTPYHELQTFLGMYQHTPDGYGLAKLILSLVEPSAGGYGLAHCIAEFDSGYREFAREIINHFLTHGATSELIELSRFVRMSYPDLAAEVCAMAGTAESLRTEQIERLLDRAAA